MNIYIYIYHSQQAWETNPKYEKYLDLRQENHEACVIPDSHLYIATIPKKILLIVP